jgi:hypothetical protein
MNSDPKLTPKLTQTLTARESRPILYIYLFCSRHGSSPLQGLPSSNVPTREIKTRYGAEMRSALAVEPAPIRRVQSGDKRWSEPARHHARTHTYSVATAYSKQARHRSIQLASLAHARTEKRSIDCTGPYRSCCLYYSTHGDLQVLVTCI